MPSTECSSSIFQDPWLILPEFLIVFDLMVIFKPPVA